MISTPADDAVTLHYQPWLNGDGQAVGLEALMRWHHQERGAISPEAFIPVFEKSGLILSLSRWALMQACSEAASWTHPLTVAVNLSPLQFTEEDLPELIALVLDTSFIAGIDRSASARWIVRTLIELGHSLELRVAAEGVETPSQHAFLIEQGCDLMQGFLLARPAAIETFAPLTGYLPALAHATRRVAPPPFAVSRRIEETARVRGTA